MDFITQQTFIVYNHSIAAMAQERHKEIDMNIRPIETHYNGYRFRSRLEARWAVFFDTLGIKYEYEPEGFELDDGLRYLPDFWLPNFNSYWEIKPEFPSNVDRIKAQKLADLTRKHVFMLYGSPGAIEQYKKPPYRIRCYIGHFADKIHEMSLDLRDDRMYTLVHDHLIKQGYDCPDYDGGYNSAKEIIEIDKQYYLKQYSMEHPTWRDGIIVNDLFWCSTIASMSEHPRGFPKPLVIYVDNCIGLEHIPFFGRDPIDNDVYYVYGNSIIDEKINNALTAARSARFEFGEKS